jgi:ribose 5-phosphate isomerase B
MAQILIASDHAGYALKEKIKDYFMNIEWNDLGTHSEERVDYPDFANLVALKMKEDPSAKAILICGSGQGMAIRANKFSHIRAALCYNKEITKLSRQHNDANVLCLGERFIKPDDAIELVKLFMNTEFEGGRHEARVQKLSEEL